jgi:hypothetical protein
MHVYCLADESDIMENLVGASQLGMLLVHLATFYLSPMVPPPKPSLGIFPLPPSLKPTPIPPQTQEAPPQSSQESARQAKLDRKAAQRSDPRNRKKGE